MNDLATWRLKHSASAHPLAGKAMTGAEIDRPGIWRTRASARFSATAAAPFCRPTTRSSPSTKQQKGVGGRQVPLIVPANEQGAGFMAAGYARASGAVGVCLVTSGPGRDQHRDAGARLHGRFGADRRDLRPGGAARAIGTDAFQEAPVAVADGLGGQARVPGDRSVAAGSDHAYRVRDRAHRPPGPVVIDMPKDVQTANGVFQGEGTLADPRLPARGCASCTPAYAERRGGGEFLQLLAQSQRPLIYAGGGVINGGAAER